MAGGTNLTFDNWDDDEAGFSSDGWTVPSTTCCSGFRCLVCGHEESCAETTCCHNFEKVELGSEEFLRHDDDFCDCHRCDCRNSGFPKCQECRHVNECDVSDELNCEAPFHFNCWCPDQPEFGETCSACPHRKYCFEPDCEVSSHCDCRVENPSESFCEGCDHTSSCEISDCDEPSHLVGNTPSGDDPSTIIPDPQLVSILERFEELRDAKNAAARDYENLRKELLEGQLKDISKVIDPVDNGATWIEVLTRDSVHFPKSSLRALAAEYPEAYAKFVRPTSSKYVIFAKTRKNPWWLRGKI